MSEIKLSRDEVPKKFTGWLLAMGCPPDKVPCLDKVTEMCRGNYYMVWRSLMEKVEAKDVVTNKRLQVFCDDVRKCQKRNVLNDRDSSVVVPEELSQWNQHSQLKEKVADAEGKVIREKESLRQTMNTVSSTLSHRKLSQNRLQNSQRRLWFLQHITEELKDKRDNLIEAKAIAKSLCEIDEGADVQSKLDKYIQSTSRQNSKASVSQLSSNAGTSMSSTRDNEDEALSTLLKRRGADLFQHLYERRTALCTLISKHDDQPDSVTRITPQSVVTHTASLHCNLALEAMKNRVHIAYAVKKFDAASKELSESLSREAYELLITRCNKSGTEARLVTLRALCDELTNRGGVFATGANQVVHGRNSTNTESAIKSKREELKQLMTSISIVQEKTQSMIDTLHSLFNSFHDESQNMVRVSDAPSLPVESMSSLRQFYQASREKHKNEVDLSMDFDVSGKSGPDFNNTTPTFVDELDFYLKNFNLEKNRKLVLEGDKIIWSFETLDSALCDIYAKWQTNNTVTPLLCPSVNLRRNWQLLLEDIAKKAGLEAMVSALEDRKKYRLDIDISLTTTEEQKVLDKIKKRLNENIFSLQKTNKYLDIGAENLRLWSENGFKKYISTDRRVDGKKFTDYEVDYLESLRM